eukprot:g12962.t1
MHGSKELEEKYNTSVWCQLEAALLQWEAPTFSEQSGWTIYDWNDLYYVLPGFIERYTFSEKNWRFFDGKPGYTRTEMICSLVTNFLNFHKEKQSKQGQKEEQ